MKKGQILEGTVERVDFPDRGIVRTEEGIVCVKNTFPGQRIRFAVTRKRGGCTQGRLIEVLQTSALEKRESVCGIFPDCGGCTWQTMLYEDQLALKEGQVRRLLEPVLQSADAADGGSAGAAGSGWDAVYEGIRSSPQEFAYRNKMEFSFGDAYRDGPLCLGLHRRGSRYDVLTADRCQLVHRDLTAILKSTLSFFQEQKIPYYHKKTHEGILRHLLVRRAESTGEILVCLVSAGAGRKEAAPALSEEASEAAEALRPVWEAFADRLLALPLEGRIVGILQMRNDSLADVVRSDQTTILYGQDFFYETLLGLRFLITPFSFFQTNSPGAEVLYRTVRDFAGGTKAKVLFDLYSGTGTIAQILSPSAEKVIGIEIVEEAVEAARLNAQLNGLANCSFLAGDVLRVLDEIRERPDLIVLDPPRDGIHPKALPKIIAYNAPRILYISCKPTSLARDLEILLHSGYRAERLCCIDMFPQTGGIETVCLLSRDGKKQ